VPDETKAMLTNYVKNGGNLLIIGHDAVSVFKEELGIGLLNAEDDKLLFIKASNRMGGIRSKIATAELNAGAAPLSWFFSGSDLRDQTNDPSVITISYGKGRIGAILFDAGSAYQQYKTFVIRDLVGETVNKLFSEPMVKVSGSKLVHVAANRKNGNTYISLINIAGEHSNQSAIGYDQVPALTDLNILVRTAGKPSSIMLQPEGKSLKFSYKNGIVSTIVPKVDVYSLVEIK
jgi:hypothetical protein